MIVYVFLLLIVVVYHLLRKWKDVRVAKKIEHCYKNKVVWITGASQGLGRSLAKQFHSAGAKVIVSARSMDALNELAKECNNTRVFPVYLDLSNSNEIKKVSAQVLSEHGPIDILLHNGGISSRSSVLDSVADIEREVMEVNFFGAVTLTKCVLPNMIESSNNGNNSNYHGVICVISSLQGKLGVPFRSAYAASKHALHGFFDSLRVEVSPFNIQVTLVCPGYIQTNLSYNAVRGDGSTHGVLDENTAKGMHPDQVALITLKAIAAGQQQVLVGKFVHKIAVYITDWFPSLMLKLLQKRSKAELQALCSKQTKKQK